MEQRRDRWEGTLYFHPDDAIYREHFCGFPVVPGSLIVHAFLTALERIGFPTERLTIENFTFREFLPPGQYPYRIELRSGRFHCLIHQEEKKLVKGILRQ
jgi:3-hydroxyacyl-[acyl-carrier-protein] dehydratase